METQPKQFEAINCRCGHLPKLEYPEKYGQDFYIIYCPNPDCDFESRLGDFDLEPAVNKWNELNRLQIRQAFEDFNYCRDCGSERKLHVHRSNDGIFRCDCCAQELVLNGKADWC